MEKKNDKKIKILDQQIMKSNDNKYLKKLNFKIIKIINSHKDWINSISLFPSGNIISVSYDKSIKIYDNNFNIIQHIQNIYKYGIIYVDVKDENNFITCSSDNSIKTWIKINNQFILNYNINNAHDDSVYNVKYYSNDKIISCSQDGTVKIWEEKDKNYQLITTLKHLGSVLAILLLKDKNILISSGINGTKLWNLNNFELIKYFNTAQCNGWNTLDKIDENRIIVGGYKLLIILSLKRIIKEIKIPFGCLGIRIIKNKGIFLIGGYNNDIMIFKNEDYECIQTIKDAHNDIINGFFEMNNDLIGSYSFDGIIKIWSFEI